MQTTKATLGAAMAAILLATAMPITGQTAGQNTSTPMANLDKSTFVKTVGAAGAFEIESSKLALQKAGSKDVKKFARQMVRDHTKAGKELTRVLKKEGETPPPAMLAPKDAETMKKLRATSGKDFEAAYVSAQHDAHEEAVSLFKAYSENPDDEGVGAFAKKTLPTLEEHLKHVNMLVTSY
jgi:putative membrane protein